MWIAFWDLEYADVNPPPYTSLQKKRSNQNLLGGNVHFSSGLYVDRRLNIYSISHLISSTLLEYMSKLLDNNGLN